VFGVMSYALAKGPTRSASAMSMGAQTGNVLGLGAAKRDGITVLGLAIGLPVAFLLARTLS